MVDVHVDTHDSSVTYVRVFQKDRLKLGWCDLEAFSLDQLLWR